MTATPSDKNLLRYAVAIRVNNYCLLQIAVDTADHLRIAHGEIFNICLDEGGVLLRRTQPISTHLRAQLSRIDPEGHDVW